MSLVLLIVFGAQLAFSLGVLDCNSLGYAWDANKQVCNIQGDYNAIHLAPGGSTVIKLRDGSCRQLDNSGTSEFFIPGGGSADVRPQFDFLQYCNVDGLDSADKAKLHISCAPASCQLLCHQPDLSSTILSPSQWASYGASDLCNNGFYTLVKTTADDIQGIWNWTCANYGGAPTLCKALKSVGGACPQGVVPPFYASSPIGGLCAVGNPSAVTANPSTGMNTWTCSGVHGGPQSNTCSSYGKFDGSCGPAKLSGTTYSSDADVQAAGLCNYNNSGSNEGYLSNAASGTATWTCYGSNGGSNATCSAALNACSGSNGIYYKYRNQHPPSQPYDYCYKQTNQPCDPTQSYNGTLCLLPCKVPNDLVLCP